MKPKNSFDAKTKKIFLEAVAEIELNQSAKSKKSAIFSSEVASGVQNTLNSPDNLISLSSKSFGFKSTLNNNISTCEIMSESQLSPIANNLDQSSNKTIINSKQSTSLLICLIKNESTEFAKSPITFSLNPAKSLHSTLLLSESALSTNTKELPTQIYSVTKSDHISVSPYFPIFKNNLNKKRKSPYFPIFNNNLNKKKKSDETFQAMPSSKQKLSDLNHSSESSSSKPSACSFSTKINPPSISLHVQSAPIYVSTSPCDNSSKKTSQHIEINSEKK